MNVEENLGEKKFTVSTGSLTSVGSAVLKSIARGIDLTGIDLTA